MTTHGPTQVNVCTWPYQWVFEPVYAAIAATQNRFSRDFQFKYISQDKQGREFDTDTAVRDALRESSSDKQVRIAICEPPTFDPQYRVIPLLWRLPVWLFGPKAFCEELHESQTAHASHNHKAGDVLLKPGIIPPLLNPVRTFLDDHQKSKNRLMVFNYDPDKTTTGQIGTRLLRALGIHDDGEMRLPRDYSRFVADCERFKKETHAVPIAISYTPLHFIRTDVTALFELAGVSERVTGVVFREDDLKEDNFNRVFEYLFYEIKGQIQRLYTSIDPFHEAKTLITLGQNRQDYYPSPSPEWVNGPTDRPILLTAFVRRGCFFPYDSLDANLSGHLSVLAADYAKQCSQLIETSLPQAFRHLIAPTVDWWSLSAAERWKVLCERPCETPVIPNANASDNDAGTAHRILHPADFARNNGRDPDRVLKEMIVSTRLGTTTLDALVFGNFDKEGGELRRKMNFRCTQDVKGNCAECYNAENDPSLPCKLCHFVGGEAALAWQIAVTLRSLKLGAIDVTEVLKPIRNAHSQRFRVSPFQLQDVHELCRVFVASFQQPASAKAFVKLFPVTSDTTDYRDGFSNKIVVCLGSMEQQTTGSGGSTRSGTTKRLTDMCVYSSENPANALRRVFLWKKSGWDNSSNTWKQCGANGATNLAEVIEKDFGDTKSKMEKFFSEDALLFCVVGVLEVME